MRATHSAHNFLNMITANYKRMLVAARTDLCQISGWFYFFLRDKGEQVPKELAHPFVNHRLRSYLTRFEI